MNGYINTVLVTVLLASVVLKCAPKSGKAFVKTVCVLCIMTAIISPLKSISSALIVAESKIRSFIDDASAPTDEYEYAAHAVMRYVDKNYSVSKIMRCSLMDGEDGEISEVQLYIKNLPRMTAEKITADLKEKLGCDVCVFSIREGEE